MHPTLHPTPPAPPRLDGARPVGEIAATWPVTIPVLSKLGLDFCCDGRRPLEDACAKKGISVDATLEALQTALADHAAAEPSLVDAPLDAVIDHILSRYHRPLDEELTRLTALAEKVLRVHGPDHGDVVEPVVRTFFALRDELIPHMHKEENVLFPWIRAGRGATAGAPVRVMLAEHDTAGGLLADLRTLTDGFVAPPGACGSWQALWAGLAQLEADAHRHIHLENSVLFPRALAG
jgi:regulator of cell morphogenesis and NO signaling